MYRVNETELRRAMDRLERWFHANVDEAFFADGVATADGPLAALHARWNGQRTEDVAFFEAFVLLDAAGCADEKAMMDGLARDGGWPETWWHPAWSPFGSDQSGQLLVLDTRSGEVLEFVHDDEVRPLHGASLEAFLTTYADDLESGRRALRDSYIVDVEAREAQLAQARERDVAHARELARARRTLGWIALGIALLVLVLILVIRFGPGA